MALVVVTCVGSMGIDPVVAAAMAHHHIDTLHPFKDRNGGTERLLVVLDTSWTVVVEQEPHVGVRLG
jgi:hypothetical protein